MKVVDRAVEKAFSTGRISDAELRIAEARESVESFNTRCHASKLSFVADNYLRLLESTTRLFDALAR